MRGQSQHYLPAFEVVFALLRLQLEIAGALLVQTLKLHHVEVLCRQIGRVEHVILRDHGPVFRQSVFVVHFGMMHRRLRRCLCLLQVHVVA